MIKQNNNPSILVIDHDQGHCKLIESELDKKKYYVETAPNSIIGKSKLTHYPFDLVILNYDLVDIEGKNFLKYIREYCPLHEVILFSEKAKIEDAVFCVKEGAYDFITKPIQVDQLQASIDKAITNHQLFTQSYKSYSEKFSLIGEDKVFIDMLKITSKLAKSESSILITGESGSGKEEICNYIHESSFRKNKPLIKINCAAIPENLLESELFGYVKGAFTGANQSKRGIFDIANGGTLFMDEVGELPLTLQAKLLRVLESKSYRPIGSEKEISFDTRFIFATNKNLFDEISKNNFREDLFYRIKVLHVHLPSLYERKSDIPLLVNHFIENINIKNRTSIKGVTPEALKFLMNYSWPGNVRELMNAVEKAMVLSNHDFLKKEDFFDLDYINNLNIDWDQHFYKIPLSATIKEAEAIMIQTALALTNGNKDEASKMLGITKRSIYRKI